MATRASPEALDMWTSAYAASGSWDSHKRMSGRVAQRGRLLHQTEPCSFSKPPPGSDRGRPRQEPGRFDHSADRSHLPEAHHVDSRNALDRLELRHDLDGEPDAFGLGIRAGLLQQLDQPGRHDHAREMLVDVAGRLR